MAARLFMYNLKSILRNKPTVFWSFLFPILLATLFFFAFGNLDSADRFKAADIAVAEGGGIVQGTPFYSALAAVSDIDGTAGKNDIFRVQKVSREEADSLLHSGKIPAYIYDDGTIRLAVSGSGFSQSLAKVFIDRYLQTSSTAAAILSENPQAIEQGLLSDLSEGGNYLTETPVSEAGANTTVIYFYALLAMTCLMGSTVSVEEIIKLQASMSSLAARINTSPVAKFKVFLCNIGAAILFQFAVVLAVLAFMIFALQVDFGGRTGYILLTCAVGSVTGIFFGTAVSTGFKSAGIKYAITIGGTMLSSFLSGLMIHDMKYVVHQYVPALEYLSPANLISDAFYSLYYFDSLERYTKNILTLCALAAVLCAATCLVMRRKTHASL